MSSRYDKYATHHTSRRTDEWDYTQPAAYFVTICTRDRVCLFGAVERGRMSLNTLGQIVADEWKRSDAIRDRLHLDAFVVMPNHLHGVVVFADPEVEAPTCPRGYRILGGTGAVGPSQKSNAEDEPGGGTQGASDCLNEEEALQSSVKSATDRTGSRQASHGGATLGPTESDDHDDDDLHRSPRSLGSFVAGFKSAATTRINDHRGSPGAAVWQRNYYDIVFRNERHWRAVREYIRQNPGKWSRDSLRREPDQ